LNGQCTVRARRQGALGLDRQAESRKAIQANDAATHILATNRQGG
jgi:hypothetical protein